eukprot:Sspe_Gene.36789::Locus_17773_Transcript_1_1_Confidence_1.000_Length_1027::g.36789::m.36789
MPKGGKRDSARNKRRAAPAPVLGPNGRPVKKKKPWEKAADVRAAKERRLPSSAKLQEDTIPRGLRGVMDWMAKNPPPPSKKEAKKRAKASEREADEGTAERPAEGGTEDSEVTGLREGKPSTLKGSFLPMQRKTQKKTKKRHREEPVAATAEEDEGEEREEVKETGRPRDWDDLVAPQPVFGEQVQEPPCLVLPKDKRSLQPAHVKKKKMAEMMEKLAAGEYDPTAVPKLQPAGKRIGGQDFTDLQRSVMEQYRKYKEKRFRARQEELGQIAKKKRVADTAELVDYL